MPPNVMRKAVLLLVMSAGIALVVWSGVRNIRDRRHAAELAPASRVTLVPDGSAASDTTATASPLRGKSAPQFTLVDLSGKKISLADFKGHPFVLNFWATYCAPCKLEMPWLEEFSHTYSAQGFKVVGITDDVEVGVPTIAKDVQQLGVTYPILLSSSKAEKDYLGDSGVLPMSFYVDKAGKVVEVTVGLGSKDQLEDMVKETIASGGAGS
jgi:thiol-disulfide isomerase/thioredoxin